MDAGNVYVSDRGHHAIRIGRPNGDIPHTRWQWQKEEKLMALEPPRLNATRCGAR